ncbi:MAG: glycosyltransferase family 4 protein, partial [Epsilonproteobacteria bacterium]|nr:glycosyltransferase family 4 protein [Campylobacterota bacterium]
LSTLKPVLCTKQPIFNDVEEIVHFTKGFSPKDMATSIDELITDKEKLFEKQELQQLWIYEHDWSHIASRVENFLDPLSSKRVLKT